MIPSLQNVYFDQNVNNLSTTYTLHAGQTYLIGTYENGAAADRSFGLPDDFCNVTTSGSLEVQGPARAAASLDGSSLTGPVNVITLDDLHTLANHQTWGPLDLVYMPITTEDLKLFEGMYVNSPGTSSFAGYRGILFKTGTHQLTLNALGRYCMSGNSHYHHIILQHYNPDAGDPVTGTRSQVLAQAIVLANSATTDRGYNYATLEQPVVLQPMTQYYLASYESCGQSSGPNDNYMANTYGPTYCTVAQSMLGYNGSAPGSINTTDPYFELDAVNAYTANPNTTGAWTELSGQFAANVNFKVR